jgi:glucose/mannose-6-phosphate isomerase
MKELIASFTAQLRQAMEIGSKAVFSKPNQEIRNVLITGLGGSGRKYSVTVGRKGNLCPNYC